MKILFLTKTTSWCERALAFARTFPVDIEAYAAEPGAPFPVDPSAWAGEAAVSYLSPWIVPQALLDGTRGPSINFHPAPPAYPGTGCYNQALYDGASRYGATCHHMLATPDTGAIIDTIGFPLSPEDGVASLKEKTMEHMLALLGRVFPRLAAADPLAPNGERWARPPYTRKDMERLRRVTPDMDAAEIRRRVRAMAYPGRPGAYVDLHGFRFAYCEERP